MKTLLSRTNIDGRIEAAADGVVIGWAWRKGESEPVDVEVIVDGESVATATARAKRKSLRREGIGNGRHGFAVELPEEFAAAGERRLEVVVLPDRVPLMAASAYSGASDSGAWGATKFVLVDEMAVPPVPASEAESETPAALVVATASPPSVQDVPGVVESVADGGVTGWVVEEVDRVIMTADGAVVAEVSADISRPDLGTGRSGFRVELPDALQTPGPHVLSVEGSGTPLVAAPHCLRPAVAPAGAWADVDLRLALFDDVALSPATPRTVLGPGGWRFEEHDSSLSLGEEEIERVATRVRAWGAAHRALAIPYVFAVLPARERLEREYLPASRAAVPERSTVDRLSTALAATFDDVPLDLLTILELARPSRPVSLRTGSGLTAWGAFYAARAVLAAAGKHLPDLQIPEVDRFPLVSVRGYRGDLAGHRAVMTEGDFAVELPLTAVPLVALGEDTELLAPDALTSLRAPTSTHLVDSDGESGTAVFECAAAPALRVLVLGSALPPVFTATVAEQVERCVVLDRLEPPLEPIELEAPHAVLHVLHERDLRMLAEAP